MLTVLLATHNPGKVKEIRSILSDLPLEIRDLSGMPDSPEVVEDGATLEENALKKASEVYERFHLLTLADDSGLEVYSLDMKPGVRSARFAGEKATYSDNNRKLLQALSGLPRDQRGARFRCVAAVAGKGIMETTEGVCTGRIAEEAYGKGGFGYDPIFIPDGFDLTFAELPSDIKNRISHRARAFNVVRDILLQYASNLYR
ncbi:MAG: RdgB/HAM1 family non-canonical purine NTP pyrophosphatase [Ignavibacteria bacterium]|nr:MAG: RdgB/HAM1 family non-canonical purine NTP pyrophosphatase [Ignavibacteria bacterium]